MISCLQLLYSYFIARLRGNWFAIITTAFALMPLGRASIRAAEQCFQTREHVDEAISRAVLISGRRGFGSILASDRDFIFGKACRETRIAFRALPLDAALNAVDPVPLDSVHFSEGLSDPDTDFLDSLLEEQLQHTHEDQLRRYLLDSIITITEEQICDHSRSCGYDEHEISLAFRLW
jgi:hypothetical protein